MEVHNTLKPHMDLLKDLLPAVTIILPLNKATEDPLLNRVTADMVAVTSNSNPCTFNNNLDLVVVEDPVRRVV